ncbi:MAG: type IV pilus assembly protein PilW [Alteromonadaceae bacterium]|jgi:type IV pilus assembly protein PilW
MMIKQRGFTLVEIFVALGIGLTLLAGVLSIFVSMKTTSKETSTSGELQENGRFALSILSDDILRQDFWGDYTGTLDFASLTAVPNAPAVDCAGEGINNATFPVIAGSFRTLWGTTVTSASMMNCIDDAKLSSDLIQLKRVVSNPVTVPNATNYYLITNISDGTIFSGAGGIPTITNSQMWEYQHHIYYVREELQGSNKVPVLMQGRLNNNMTFDPIIDGIEIIRFMYGVDNTGDGIVNAFISADNMTDALWNNANDSNILAIKVYVLARSILPDNKYDNTNTYQIGDLSFTFNDNYRRLLFSSTITLYNAGVDVWN